MDESCNVKNKINGSIATLAYSAPEILLALPQYNHAVDNNGLRASVCSITHGPIHTLFQ